jgi:hypothetical protein
VDQIDVVGDGFGPIDLIGNLFVAGFARAPLELPAEGALG